MSHSLPLQPAGFLIATAALLVMHSDGVGATPVAASRPKLTTHTIGTVELIDSFSCAPRVADDEAISIARERVTSDVHSATAARAQLVREHLRVFDGPGAMLRDDLAEQEFQAQRAELRAARLDLARAEEGRDGAACARPYPSGVAGVPPQTALEIRMELPATLLRPLQQALIYDSDLVVAYPGEALDRSAQPVVGKLASVESTLHGSDPIVVVRARIADPATRLRSGDIVAVDLQLDSEATADADAMPLTAETP